jgi:L-fucose isomerase-like protein
VRVSSLDGDWLAALGLLAEAQADGTRPVVELLARESGPASRALETVVVTARLSGALATKLLQRSLAAQGVSVVWVDAPSFAGRPTRVEPELLRLQAAGVAVAVIRRGDSLAAVLGAQPARRSAHA